MAGSSMPLLAQNRSGLDRWVHEKAGPAAIAFVTLATLFSLCTQAYYLGGVASQIAGQLDMPVGLLVLGLLPHAVPELVVLFLPLAAWLIASHKDRWDELLAATAVCVADRGAGAAGHRGHRAVGLAGPDRPARRALTHAS